MSKKRVILMSDIHYNCADWFGIDRKESIEQLCADLAKEYAPDADMIGMARVTDIVADLVSGKLDGAFVEKMVAESYEKIYPELCVAFEVDYEDEGAVIGVAKGNDALLKAVNEALAAASADGSMETFAAKAVEQAYGTVGAQ